MDNITVSGSGITHPFALISGKGAIMNLSGDNTLGSDLLTDPVTGNLVTVGSNIYLDPTANPVNAGIGVENLGPEPVSSLTLTAWMADAPGRTGGGITKYGSQTLFMQGPGTYTGNVDIREGVVEVQNETALGQASSGTANVPPNISPFPDTFPVTSTTVETGALLQLAGSIATNNGGIAAGLQIANERLVLNSAGANWRSRAHRPAAPSL